MTYYTVLELQPDATPEAIRQAYLRLARTTHPDRVSGNDRHFIAIKDAYDVLSDPAKRHAYDQWLADGGQGEYTVTPSIPRPQWRIVPEPFTCTHYAFVNQFLNTPVDDEEYLVPGQVIEVPLNRCIRSKLRVASGVLYNQQLAIKWQLQSMPPQDPQYRILNEQVKVLEDNERKIGQVACTLLAGFQGKFIYDLSLGPEEVTQTQAMEEMARLIGGRDALRQYLAIFPSLLTVNVFFALQQIGCLNPENFARFAGARTSASEFLQLGYLINQLSDTHLLNQTNFEIALTHSDPAALAHGIGQLEIANLANQLHFEKLLTCHNAEATASSLRLLKDYNMLSEFNYHKVFELSVEHDIDIPLIDIIARSGRITPEDGLALQWSSPRADVQSLCQRIDEVFAYGLTLAVSDKDKALPVFLLALDLKKALRDFYALPAAAQAAQGAAFHQQFLVVLHSRDAELAQHRQYWKVLLANAAIALTGLGLLALVGHALATGHGFFHRTQREQLRDGMEEQWIMTQPISSV